MGGSAVCGSVGLVGELVLVEIGSGCLDLGQHQSLETFHDYCHENNWPVIIQVLGTGMMVAVSDL